MLPSSWAGRVSATVAALTLAACAGNAGLSPAQRANALLSDAPAPPGRSCRVVPTPATLPNPEQLVDVAELGAELRRLPRPEAGVQAFVLLSMGYDRFGSNIRRSVIETNMGAAVADSVQKLVFAHRRATDSGDVDWGVRLRVELGEVPGFTVGRSEICSPRPHDTELAMAIEAGGRPTVRGRDGQRYSTVWVRLAISSRGTVAGAAVERGLIPGGSTEQRIFDQLRSLFFEPALQDGHPVDGTLSVPVLLRQR